MQQSNNAKIINLSPQNSGAGSTVVDWGIVAPEQREAPQLRKFSTAATIYSGVGESITFQAFFEGIKGGRWRESVEAVRGASGANRASLKNKLFTVYPSVLMRGQNKSASSIDQYTGILAVDVDGKDNAPDLLDWAPEALRRDQFTFAFHKSCGGAGLVVYYLVDSTKTEHSAAYRELAERLYQLHNINADPACINANRARLVSWDTEAYINAEADSWQVAEVPANIGREVRDVAALGEGEGHQIIVAAITAGVDLTTTEFHWFRLGKWIAQQYGDDGRELFHQLSQFHPKYNTRQTDNKFTALVRSCQLNSGRVSDNIPRIIAHELAPELLAAVKGEGVSQAPENRHTTGENVPASQRPDVVTKSAENSGKTAGVLPVSLAIDLSAKEAHRATIASGAVHNTTATAIVPQSAPNRPKTEADFDRLLASTKYHHKTNFMPPPSVISIGGERFATAGNFSVLVGLQKSGKGFVLSAIAAAYLRGEGGQCLSFKASPIEGKPDVVIVDTEQDEGDLNTTTERLRRALTEDQFSRLTVYSWRAQAPADALAMLPRVLAAHPSAGLVIVDGIADLSPSGVNDDVGARDVAHKLKALTTQTGVHVVTVIHLNKHAGAADKAEQFSQVASTAVAGHLGINLQRKAETVIGVHKDREKKLHSVHPINTRGRDFESFAFTIARAIEMPQHVTAVQYEAIKASESNPTKDTAASIDVTTHRELVTDVFTVGSELSTSELLMHIARVVGRRTGGKASDRYCRTYHAEWQSLGLIEATKEARHPRQSWRAVVPDQLAAEPTAEPEQTASPAPAELFVASTESEAKKAPVQKRKTQAKKGGNRGGSGAKK